MALIDNEKLIHDLIQILHDDVCAPNGHLDPYYVFKTIKDQPQLATNLQPTCNELATDCISRQAAIDAVREAYENDEMFDGYEYRLEELPSVQPDQRSFSCGQENDMISRQDAIEAILAVTGNSSVRELYEHVQEHGLSDMWSGGVNAAIDIIIAVPSAQPEQRWIPLGRPMNSGTYLVTLRQKFEGEESYRVRIMRLIEGHWVLPKHFPEWINEEMEQEVLAWMPLPEPYGGEME